ncbi:MAG: coenzyme F420-0:L-glutamate ligase [Gammaproteobacteria bacterium TMED236]|nr:MAG: coenzyme F420-0:L-glutamate ligase [Gammaproteobacteria bacterium TMED236]
MSSIKLIALETMPLIQPGQDLSDEIINAIASESILVDDGDVIAIAQKIVSKSENRYLDISSLSPSEEAKTLSKQIDKDPKFIQAILNESKKVVRYRMGVLIVEHKLGFIHANAGIDRSNIDQEQDIVLLLPEDPDESAKEISQSLSQFFKKNVSVIITDTMGRPFRNGIVGFTIGSHNIESILDERGQKDLYGNELKVTQIGIADELAAAASLLMGQAAQKKPVVIIKGYKFKQNNLSDSQSLIRGEEEDLFR